MSRAIHVVLAAGGTAGHIEPALNLADALVGEDPEVVVTIIGGDHGLETSLVPSRGYALKTVPAVVMPRRISTDLLKLVPKVSAATKQAVAHLQEITPDVIVGFGGYAALPTYRAAKKLGYDLIIHEANAKAGLANRVGARYATEVYVTVPGSLPGVPMSLPLRQSIVHLDRADSDQAARAGFGLSPTGPVLLVFGGSQGAQHINESLAQALPRLLASGVQVLHGYGPKNQAPDAQAGYVPLPYIDRMDQAYAAADLAITRAGAMTVAEVAAIGLPTIFVPLPIGNGEQRVNALTVVQVGGGLLIDNEELTPDRLLESVTSLIHSPDQLLRMGTAAQSVGVRDAAQRLAVAVLRVAHQRRARTGEDAL
ncbi:MAG: undecaprenyldiphospho-muramoylpentapeptide beta-N-acetylglucosaminyltransferase [Actinomycetota bacterium]|nr:undecaprenyldiphospho-muramoylpentapeptide beta-N-acetylglucosaminyltransferase [Actinomycetota bacterium]